MKVIIPMSGIGKRFTDAGFTRIKPLIEVDGKPVIAHLLERFPAHWPKVFICNEEHLRTTPLEAELKRLAPEGVVVPIPPHKKGPVWAVLEGLRRQPAALGDDEPCIVNYCDFSFSWDARDFEAFTQRSLCDGALLCYTGFHPEYLRPTLYAYVRQENGHVLEVREKGHFTPDRTREYASSGSYYFRNGAIVRKYFETLMNSDALINGEGYVSLVYNPMIQDGLDVRIHEIPYFFQWGTPADLADYRYWSNLYHRYLKSRPGIVPAHEMQLLMPMAGRGSRFNSNVPKPFIPILEQPMFLSALRHLPGTKRQTLVVLREISKRAASLAPEAKVVTLEAPTNGQALTCAAAESELDPELPVLVSSCDHGILWDDSRLRSLLGSAPDVVVFGQRGYPGAGRTPNAFAYIEAHPGTDRIRLVSVKQPLSAAPENDLLLIGTFIFKKPALLLELVEKLKNRDIRVNGELYLDSVVNLAVESGLDARVFETDGYLCWGTPEAVLEFDYWNSYFSAMGSLNRGRRTQP